VASDRYTPQQLADMARRLDECIEVSALCMDLALAGEMHRQALAATAAAQAHTGSGIELQPGAAIRDSHTSPRC
jgi:hypothetical protein